MESKDLKFVEKPQDFPKVSDALIEPDGLLAFSNELSSNLLISAYQNGIFPWFTQQQPVLWWSPSVRAILVPAEIKLRKSLRQSIRKNKYTLSINRDFNRVIKNCATIKRPDQDDTWINQQMIEAYTELHTMGHAHSIECWKDEVLVGGLYGIFSQGIFCGESMFSKSTDASKVCLLGLAQNAEELGIHIIDCQMMNPYLESMGAKELSRKQFLNLLKQKFFKLSQPQKDVLSIKI